MKKLSRNEMKKVMGGDGPYACRGHCTGSVGEWEYVPERVSYAECLNDIAAYCSSGSGGCSTSCSDEEDSPYI